MQSINLVEGADSESKIYLTGREVSPLAAKILREIHAIGALYQRGLARRLNPRVEQICPKLSQAFGGPGRLLGFISIATFLYVFLHLAEPASAQFLQAGQDYVEGLEFFEGAAELVNIFFGILRAIIIIVLGYFVVRIALAVRQDEDWQTFVRWPVFIVGAIAIVDFLTIYIVGG